jgi:hypothetical protein
MVGNKQKKSTLAEREDILPKNMGGSGICIHILCIFWGFCSICCPLYGHIVGETLHF